MTWRPRPRGWQLRVVLTQDEETRDQLWYLPAVPGVLVGEGRQHQMLLHADLDLKQNQADREEHDPLTDPAEQRRAEQHPEHAGVDRMTCHCVRPVGAELVIIFDLGR